MNEANRLAGGCAPRTGNAGDGVHTEKTAKITGGTRIEYNGGDGVRSKGAALLKQATIVENDGTGVRTDGTVNVVDAG